MLDKRKEMKDRWNKGKGTLSENSCEDFGVLVLCNISWNPCYIRNYFASPLSHTWKTIFTQLQSAPSLLLFQWLAADSHIFYPVRHRLKEKHTEQHGLAVTDCVHLYVLLSTNNMFLCWLISWLNSAHVTGSALFPADGSFVTSALKHIHNTDFIDTHSQTQ